MTQLHRLPVLLWRPVIISERPNTRPGLIHTSAFTSLNVCEGPVKRHLPNMTLGRNMEAARTSCCKRQLYFQRCRWTCQGQCGESLVWFRYLSDICFRDKPNPGGPTICVGQDPEGGRGHVLDGFKSVWLETVKRYTFNAKLLWLSSIHVSCKTCCLLLWQNWIKTGHVTKEKNDRVTIKESRKGPGMRPVENQRTRKPNSPYSRHWRLDAFNTLHPKPFLFFVEQSEHGGNWEQLLCWFDLVCFLFSNCPMKAQSPAQQMLSWLFSTENTCVQLYTTIYISVILNSDTLCLFIQSLLFSFTWFFFLKL